MGRKVSARIASVALFVHGFVELIGAVALLALPREFLTTRGYVPKEEKMAFMIALAFIFGLSRLASGYPTWTMKKWGIIFGIVLGVTTMIGAPLLYVMGTINFSALVMDLLLAVIAVAFSLSALFGGETIVSMKE